MSHAHLTFDLTSFLTLRLARLYLQRLFPEKLSRCRWLPAVSEAVVKHPCVRLPLATVTTTVIIISAVFNLVSLHSQVKCYKRVIVYAAISSCCYFRAAWTCPAVGCQSGLVYPPCSALSTLMKTN